MIAELCKKINIEDQAANIFENCLLAIKEKDLTDDFEKAMDIFICSKENGYDEILSNISKTLDIHRYTVDMTFLLAAAGTLFDIYMAKGYSEELFYNVMADVRSKMVKCHKIHGVYGNSFIDWERGFYKCERFAFGRLQMGRLPFNFMDDYKGIIKRGDIVCDCHIPATGPLLYDDVIASFKNALEFYRQSFPDGILKVTCYSWLLYPPHYDLFPENSNLRRFFELFDVVKSDDDPQNGDFWRIFYKQYSPDILDNLPRDTTLQRNFLDYIKNGGCMGNGYGIILFDGEKII